MKSRKGMIMAEVKPEPEPEPPWAIDKAVKFWQHSQYPDLSSDFLLSRLEQAKDHSPLFSRFEILVLEQICCLSAVSDGARAGPTPGPFILAALHTTSTWPGATKLATERWPRVLSSSLISPTHLPSPAIASESPTSVHASSKIRTKVLVAL